MAKRAKKVATKKKAKKPAFKSLKSAGRALKRKAKKATKLDRNTPSQNDAVARRIEAMARANVIKPDGFPVRRTDTRWPKEIVVGKRHRKDFGDLKELAQSIDDRGGLIHSIAIGFDDVLIAGERRLKAWPMTKFAAEPIPVKVMDIDSVLAGEWDENAKRKQFTPSESAAISEAIERQLKKLAAARMKGGKKVDGAEKGNVVDLASRATGMGRRTIDKAKAVVKAAKEDPERFGHLQQQMDKTNKVDGPFKRLQIMLQKDAINKAPAPLPMRGPYNAIVVDFPWPAEKDADQETIDKRGRAMRDYPEMSIEEGKKLFRSAEFQALVANDCRIYLWSTNHHVDSAFEMMKAAGFGKHSTMGTWLKNKMGNGQVMRGDTEQCIMFERGKPVTDIARADGSHWRTGWTGPGWEVREDSRKPDAFFDMVEQHTPSPRYAEIFSRGGRNDKWDCHGDQAGKFAPSVAKEAQAAILKEIQLTPAQQLLRLLEAIEKGETPDLRLIDPAVGKEFDQFVTGDKTMTLNADGQAKLVFLRTARVLSPKLNLVDVKFSSPLIDAINGLLRTGHVVWEADGKDSVGAIAQNKAGHFVNARHLGVRSLDMPTDRHREGVHLRRKGNRVEITGYRNEAGTGFMYSTMPMSKVETFLRRWSKAGVTLPLEAEIPRKEERKAQATAKAKRQTKAVVVGKTLPGRDLDLINFASIGGHIVRNTIDQATGEHVATCECGQFEHRYKAPGRPGKREFVEERVQLAADHDAAVTAHWAAMRDQVRETAPAEDKLSSRAPDGESLGSSLAGVATTPSGDLPAPASDAASEMPPIPDFLRRAS